MAADLTHIDDPLGLSLAAITTDVVILPEHVGSGGEPAYRDELVYLKKDLLAAGVSADHYHPSDVRRWQGLFGDVVGQITVGLLTSGAVAAVQVWIQTRWRSDRVRARVARAREAPDGTREFEWYEVEGPGEEVVAALDVLKRDHEAP